MFNNLKVQGPGMTKYALAAFIVNIAIAISWIVYIVIPYGKDFIAESQIWIDTGHIELMQWLKPVGIIILGFAGTQLLSFIIVGGIIFSLASNHIKNQNRFW